jgi:hypothetical protein
MQLSQNRFQWRADFCEHGSEHQSSIEDGQFLGRMSDYELPKKDYAQYS